ncbi:hypothetical protein K439DRAFT_1618809 [Ramaria rubella]|nr:hypothetical protein K439DRAFT_1618809 [Ramaria rubella]
MHDLQDAFKIDPDTIESISTTRHRPSWTRPFIVQILPLRKDALDFERQNNAHIKLYSDGSKSNNGVGAAVAIFIDGVLHSSLTFHLGKPMEYSIYETELPTCSIRSIFPATIGADNQAALAAHWPKAGHYLVDALVDHLSATMHSAHGLHLILYWVPGHEGIVRNKAVDKMVKDAADSGSSRPLQLPALLHRHLPHSTSAVKQSYKDQLKQQASQLFKASTRYPKISSIDPTTPSAKFRKLTMTLSRSQASLLIQLCTGHVALNKHLATIGAIESPTCPSCMR